MENFLNIGGQKPNELSLMQNMSLQENPQLNLKLKKSEQNMKQIQPSTGFCIKARDENGTKVFINVCHCADLPKPKDISETQLLELLESESGDPMLYRVPLSLGEPHKEEDKNGKECMCYDVILNTDYYGLIKTTNIFRRFVIQLCCEGIQDKYGVNIDAESCIVLKNKAYYGTMPQHYIKIKPVIEDLGSSTTSISTKVEPPKIQSQKDDVRPQHILRKFPASGFPEKLILDVELPNVTDGSTICLSVGEDRIILREKTKPYVLDIFVPYDVIQQKCTSIFYMDLKVLTLNMPVIGKSDSVS